MIRIYTVLNLLLGVVALAATGLVFVGRESVRQIKNDKPALETDEHAVVGEDYRRQNVQTFSTTAQDVETLWENVIFNPARREGIGASAAPLTPEEERTMPTNIQLMAIGVVGSRAVAVVVVEDPQTRRSETRVRGRRTSPAGTQNVYSLGEEVTGTGYTVTEIKMEEVILSRGDEERVLRLMPSGEASQQRREAAVRQENEARRRDAIRRFGREGEAQTEEPPSPPPVPGIASEEQPDDAEMSRDEQIRRTIERRREAIEELRRRQREQ